ncbi:alpha-glucosidase-like [Gordionus sp. m RMFG-2023]|uniref:alpha-glucosidase-like n=1 Tax=Gordionus sp. m RMFG-2023 TaxID=3053472 RepID=UPI0031FD169A
MKKDELLLFCKRPFWVRSRIALLVALLSIWLIIFSNATTSEDVKKTCNVDKWWKHSIMYEVYPRSFQDSNGDGIGDLKGIISRLDYFTYLGIDAIWLTPVYKSPMKDFGYDIADFVDIDPLFGDLHDFKELVAEAHNRNIKIIMNFVPNHTSREHNWFNMSCQAIDPYKDYYVWKNGKLMNDGKMGPPNNWLGQFGGSAWTWNSQRNQFYYHAFLKELPDLNFENPKVIEEMKKVLRFWLDLGVDGFRIDAVSNLHEDQRFLDELINDEGSISASKDEFNYLKHVYVRHQPKTITTVTEFVNVIRSYEKCPDTIKAIMIEDYNEVQNLMDYYDKSGADFPYNFDFVGADAKQLGGLGTLKLVDTWMKYMIPPKKSIENDHKSNHSVESSHIIDYSKRWPNWVTSNHDRHRFATRSGENMTDAFHMLILLLPGTPTIYYGGELGMTDIDVPSFSQTQDSFALNMGLERYKLYTRDPERAPMQWDSSPNAGFTTSNSPWLPVNPDYVVKNFQTEKDDKMSHLNIFRALVKLRREKEFRDINIGYGAVNKNIFSFVRKNAEGTKGYFIILNLGREPDYYPLEEHSKGLTPANEPLKVLLTTPSYHPNSAISIGNQINLFHSKEIELNQGLMANRNLSASLNNIHNMADGNKGLRLESGQGIVLAWGSDLPDLL